jgi:hypothetical protein
LHVADRDLGRLREAQSALPGDVPVTFLLATDPSQTHRGVVHGIALNTESVDGRTLAAPVVVRLIGTDIPDPHAGAGVIARIHCGRRSIGYVWLHDLIDAVRTRLWF